MGLSKGPKAWLAEGLHSMRIFDRFDLGSLPWLPILNYHRIRPSNPSFATPFADGVFAGPTVDEFDRQMCWLSRRAEILSEDDLIAALRSGGAWTRPGVMVTFDDGYLDNYTLAFPILKHYRVPAIFFIPAGLTSSRRLGWWDLISYFIKRTGKSSLAVGGRRYQVAGTSSLVIQELMTRMRTEPAEQTQFLLQEISQAAGVAFPDPEMQSGELMTWDQIREVEGGGITIGSHTLTHRVLSTLDSQAQEVELRASKTLVETQIGRPVRSIAYPVGDYGDFNLETQRIAEGCGYELGFSFATGVNRRTRLRPFDVKRVSAPATTAFLAAKVKAPLLFGSA